MSRTEKIENRHEQGRLHMFHMPIQEESPANPTNSPTYINQPQRNENLQASTTHQVAGPHIRLKAIIQTTYATPGKLRGSCSGMPADACKHTRWPEPSEHEDLIQHLCTTSNIVCITSVVEQQKGSNKKDRKYTKQITTGGGNYSRGK